MSIRVYLKRSFISLLFLFLVILISGCILGPIIENSQNEKIRYHLIITRVSNSEDIIDPIGNLTKADLIDIPILLNAIETMVTNESIQDFSSDITKE